MNKLKNFLSEELRLNPDNYLGDFMKYEELILEWNKKINLVSRKTDSIEDHILNSIFFLTKYNFDNIKSLADIGTGGGFPGIPLKILYPDLNLLLVDSIQKKVSVLNDLIVRLELINTEAVCGRAEIVSKESRYINKFDCVISKAVAGLDNLYEWGNVFLNDSGTMICIKGGDIETELSELKKLRYNFKVEVINFDFERGYGIEEKKIVVISHH
ncbi:MAG TPA: 16S rRNA (guanine(527)-N(7))-methyltransferase RsmG [Ignavibacteria bacterium]|nr:16S rRNA (guanine(527)-N(7))-methyltransferase RsmG [Ignavibacteria bacterium]